MSLYGYTFLALGSLIIGLTTNSLWCIVGVIFIYFAGAIFNEIGRLKREQQAQ